MVREIGAEALDLTLRPLDHRFEIGDEFLVHGIIRGTEGVERGRARPVENPQHCQFFGGRSLDARSIPQKRLHVTREEASELEERPAAE